MSFFSSPSVAAVKPEPTEDVSGKQKLEREALRKAAADAEGEVADKAKRRFEGRTMGTAGANSMFTSNAAGYGRTLGNANV